jgi:hypothetical protein
VISVVLWQLKSFGGFMGEHAGYELERLEEEAVALSALDYTAWGREYAMGEQPVVGLTGDEWYDDF